MIYQPNIIPVSLDGKELYQLWENYPYRIGDLTETAREGYIMDGASVPYAFQWLLARDGTHRGEALKHDWGYDGRGVMECGLTLSKEEIDFRFYAGLASLGTIPRWRCAVAWLGVHDFGGKAWKDGDGTRLVLPVGSLSPSIKPRKKKLLKGMYD